MRGIKESKLLDMAMRKDQEKVPIGAPFLVNNKSRMDKSVAGLVTLDRVETPELSQVEVYGEEDMKANRDVTTNRLRFDDQVDATALRLVEGAFKPDIGVVILTRANKEQLEIRDFLRVEHLGHGKTGSRGVNGRDGFNAKDGREGDEGDEGCPGPPGREGDDGEAGDDGEDGPAGITGPDGCDGQPGPQGPQGPLGHHGYEGPRGLKGPSCDSDDGTDEATGQGTAGAQGLMFGEGVWIGTPQTASMSVAIVGLADDGIDGIMPAAPGGGGTGQPSTPAPPPSIPSPPLPVDPPKPVPPTPVPAGSITLCTRQPNDVSRTCNANNKWWAVSYIFKGVKVGRALATSTFHRPNNTAWWPHGLVFCGTYTNNANYRAEFTVPAGIIGSYYINCGTKANIDGVGGTKTFNFTGKWSDEHSVKLVGKSQKIPVWFALSVFNDAGTLVYHTGMNVVVDGKLTKDDNWSSNTNFQTIGPTDPL